MPTLRTPGPWLELRAGGRHCSLGRSPLHRAPRPAWIGLWDPSPLQADRGQVFTQVLGVPVGQSSPWRDPHPRRPC